MKSLWKDKKIFSWALYDWANSSFSTTIMAGFFPVFFKEYWSQGADATLTTARLGTTISLGSLIIAVLSPTLGAFADQRGYKKLFTFLFMLIGLSGCAWMSFIEPGGWIFAAIAYSVAQLGFNASCVFYDSLLPSIAPGKKADFASSLGYGLGYLGGGVLFLFNVIMYLKPEIFGLDSGVQAVKLSFLSVALWWGIFSIPLFRNIPEPSIQKTGFPLFRAIHHSITSLFSTLKDLFHQKNTLIFMIAYWLYIDGVYTVMTMAVDYGMSIGLKSSDLISALLIVQFIGFPFAMLFSKMASKWGCRIPILTCIALYGITVIFATKMTTGLEFYLLACVIGMIQGGVQALSRSLFSRMVPSHATGEYFGLFNLVGKFASIFGPMLVGWGAYLSGNPRQGMLGLLVLFVIGGGLLFLVKEPAD
ncbi:MAG: MFS transporter [Oligoflexia bacterium]|nr:MAG: MFS transporter [Oligoflexia bacterium]